MNHCFTKAQTATPKNEDQGPPVAGRNSHSVQLLMTQISLLGLGQDRKLQAVCRFDGKCFARTANFSTAPTSCAVHAPRAFTWPHPAAVVIDDGRERTGAAHPNACCPSVFMAAEGQHAPTMTTG